jgi:indole-3-glycerol phosphate synthase
LRPDLDPADLAREYVAAGAATLSVLTDGPGFGGSLELMRAARAAAGVPVLRKEFIVDEYQLVEARAHGADAVLLIAGVLDAQELARLHDAAMGLGLDVLVEVHNEAELEIVAASRAPIRMLGINNRDLKAQKTDLATFERLAPAAHGLSDFLVAESGLRTQLDAARMQAAGARALLVGESLLRASRPGEALRALLAAPQDATRS